jgi:hypothetical protein
MRFPLRLVAAYERSRRRGAHLALLTRELLQATSAAIDTPLGPPAVDAAVAHALNIALTQLQIALELSGDALPKDAEAPMRALHGVFVTLRSKPDRVSRDEGTEARAR